MADDGRAGAGADDGRTGAGVFVGQLAAGGGAGFSLAGPRSNSSTDAFGFTVRRGTLRPCVRGPPGMPDRGGVGGGPERGASS